MTTFISPILVVMLFASVTSQASTIQNQAQAQAQAQTNAQTQVRQSVEHPQLLPVSLSKNDKSLQATIDYDDIQSGSLYFKNPQGVQHSLVLSSDYQVEITGLMARIKLTQRFYNSGSDWAEGVYVFPLTQGVAVDAMQIKLGERVIKANIKRREKAAEIYQTAKKAGKKSALLEQQRPNLFTTKIANIPGKEYIEVQISYLQTLPIKDDTFSLRLPLTITPRYIPAPLQTDTPQDNARQNSPSPISPSSISTPQISTTPINIDVQSDERVKKSVDFPVGVNSRSVQIDQKTGWGINNIRVPDASEITPWQMPSYQAQQASIKVNLNVGVPVHNVKSLYHPINFSGDNIALNSETISMNRDFVLQWSFKPQASPQAAFFTEHKDGFDYGLMFINPPLIHATKSATGKEFIYIIDTSGSMAGVAIRQAKQALSFGISQLGEHDRFNVIEFNSEYSALFQHSLKAISLNKALAKHWISQLNADGGTNMLPALQAALKLTPSALSMNDTNGESKKSNRQVIFITDGSIGNEVELFKSIDQSIADTRLHTVGIGSAPNSYFMEQAAVLGRGTYNYIGDLTEVEHQMSELFKRINKPMLTDITFSFSNELTFSNEKVELLPTKIPDLYVGQPLIVSARWPAALSENANYGSNTKGTATKTLATKTFESKAFSTQARATKHIKLSGYIDGQSWSTNLQVVNAKSQSGVATWWAREKIKQLNFLLLRPQIRATGIYDAQLPCHRTSSTCTEQQQADLIVEDITQLALNHQLMSKYTSFVAVEEVVRRKTVHPAVTKPIMNAMPLGSTQVIPFSQTATPAKQALWFGLVLMALSCSLFLFSRCWYLNQHQVILSTTKTVEANERGDLRRR